MTHRKKCLACSYNLWKIKMANCIWDMIYLSSFRKITYRKNKYPKGYKLKGRGPRGTSVGSRKSSTF